MPPLAAAVAVYFAVSMATAYLIIAVAVVTLASIGMTAYSIASSPSTDFSNELKGRQQTVRSAISPHRVIYGEVIVGGTLVFAHSEGESNERVHLVIALAGHEVEEIGDVWLGDRLSTDEVFNADDETEGRQVPSDGVLYMGSSFGSHVNGTVTVSRYYVTSYVDVSPSLYSVGADHITFDPSLAGSFVQVKYKTSYVKVTKYLGTDTQAADPDLVDVSGGLWTENHRLRGIAYLVVQFAYSPQIFPTGLPNVKARIKGRKVYDPRTGLTAYSNNWALCTLDYLLSPFGLGCNLTTEIDTAAFIAAANISDETVQIHAGNGAGYTTDTAGYEAGRSLIRLVGGTGSILAGDSVTITIPAGNYGGNYYDASTTTYLVKYSLDSSGYLALADEITAAIPPHICAVSVVQVNSEHRYTCNGTFTLDQKPIDIMQRLLSAGMGRLVYQQGTYKLKAGAYSGVAGALNEDDLRGAITVQTKQSKQNRFNGVQGTFSDPLKNWQPSDFPLVTNPLYVAEDMGEEVNKDVELSFTTSAHSAQRIAKIMLEKNRQGITVNFPAKFTAFQYTVGDVLQVSVAQLGWVNKEFEVIGWTLGKDGAGVDLTLQEEASACYDWNYGEATQVDLAPDTVLPNPWVVAAPANLAVTEELYRGNALGVIMTRGILTWASADGMAQRYRVRLDGVTAGETTDTRWVFNGLSPQPYQFGVAAVNALGVESPYSYINYSVIGKTAPPPAVLSFLVNRQPDGTREFTWEIDAPLDLAGFRIRYKSGTDAVWDDMQPLHSGLLLAGPYETNQLPAGDYVFAIISEDTSGNQSTAVYIETTLEDPRLADMIADRYPHKVGWPGALTNCYLDERGYLVAKDQKTWADFATDSVTWAGWTSWARNPYTSITYTDEVIDLGVSVAFTPSVTAQADGSVAAEMRTSDDNSTWSSWGALAFTVHRYVQLRVTITNSIGLAVLKSATIYLSGKPVVVEINDLSTSALTGSYRTGTGDIRLPVAGKFAKINTVFITLQNVGAGWSYELIDKTSTYGPRVKIYNASGALADATIDAYIKGL